jgi:hypothetical protein
MFGKRGAESMKNIRGRKIAILAGILLLALLVGSLIPLRRPPSTPPQSIPTPTVGPEAGAVLPEPLISKKVTYSVGPLQESRKTTLRKYTYNGGAVTEGEARTYLTKIGMSAPITASKIWGGTIYRAATGNRYFTVTGNPPKISYKENPTNNVRAPIDSGKLDSEARGILNTLGVLPPGGAISPATFIYLAASGPHPEKSTPEDATLVWVKYYLMLDGVPVFSANPEDTSFLFKYNADGSLISYDAYDLSKVFDSGQAWDILPVNDAASRLRSGEGALTSMIPEEDMELYPSDFSVQTAYAQNAILGYYMNAAEGSITPIYLFNSQAQDTLNSRPVRIGTFVSALR